MPRSSWHVRTVASILGVVLPGLAYADGLSSLSVLVIPITLFATLFLLLLQGVFTAVLKSRPGRVAQALGGIVAVSSLLWNLLAFAAIAPEAPDRYATTGLYIWFGADVLLLTASCCTGIYMLSLLRRTPSP